MTDLDLLRRLPKAELHVHLDGSLRPSTLVELAREAGVALPSTDPVDVARFMRVDDARDLDDYLRRFDITVAVLQDPEAIERVAWEMVADAHADGVRLLEVRYCPWLSTAGGLTLDEVIASEARGLARGTADFGVRTGIINCSLRHYPPERSLAIAEASVRWRGRGVVGFDLAGGEAGRPPTVHRAAFDVAALGGLGITVHAGEAAGPDSIREAVALCGAQRLGHGTRLHEDPALQDQVRDRRILLEVNITSNLQTRAVARAADHPVRRYVEAGLAVTLGTDSWLISGVSLSGEYALAERELGFSRAQVDGMILDGFRHAFLPWPERTALVEAVHDELRELT